MEADGMRNFQVYSHMLVMKSILIDSNRYAYTGS